MGMGKTWRALAIVLVLFAGGSCNDRALSQPGPGEGSDLASGPDRAPFDLSMAPRDLSTAPLAVPPAAIWTSSCGGALTGNNGGQLNFSSGGVIIEYPTASSHLHFSPGYLETDTQ
jgi:hypothetical protein